MSVPVSVDGIILDDETRYKKGLTDERRILRLKQVREESNNLARRIRNGVEAEKKRQLRKLEQIKAKELDCWRRHVLLQKYNDYRGAIFQVGMAHKAAQEENARKEEEKLKPKPKESLFQRQVRVRRSYNKYDYNNAPFIKKQKPKCSNKPCNAAVQCRLSAGTDKRFSTTNTTVKIAKTSVKTKLSRNASAGAEKPLSDMVTKNSENLTQKQQGVKRKRHSSYQKRDCCNTCDCSELSSESDGNADSSSDEDTSCSCTSKSSTQITSLENKSKAKLKQTPAVLLEVQNDGHCTDSSLEVQDKYVPENRQFTRIVQESPGKRHKPYIATSSDNETEEEVENNIRINRFDQVSKVLAKQAKERAKRQSNEKLIPRAPPPSPCVKNVILPVRRGTTVVRNHLVKSASVHKKRKSHTRCVKPSGKPILEDCMEEDEDNASDNSKPRSKVPQPSPAKVSSSQTFPAKSPRIRIHSSPTGAFTMTVGGSTTSVGSGEQKETKREHQIEVLEREKQEVFRDVEALTQKLTTLARDCANFIPQSQRDKQVDRACSPCPSQPSSPNETEKARSSIFQKLISKPKSKEIQPSQTKVPEKVTVKSKALEIEKTKGKSTVKPITSKNEQKSQPKQKPTEPITKATQPKSGNFISKLFSPKKKIVEESEESTDSSSEIGITTTKTPETNKVSEKTTESKKDIPPKKPLIIKEIPRVIQEPKKKVDAKASSSNQTEIAKKKGKLFSDKRSLTKEVVKQTNEIDEKKAKKNQQQEIDKSKKSSPQKTKELVISVDDKIEDVEVIQSPKPAERVSRSFFKSSKKSPKKSVQEDAKSAAETSKDENTESGYSLVLIEYVCDQSKLLLSDLSKLLAQPHVDTEKCEKIQHLLERNELLCKQLKTQLKLRKQEDKKKKNDNDELKCVLDAVCNVRKEREIILATNEDLLKEREQKIQRKEALLQQKMYKLQKQEESKQTTNDKPVEIVITVQGARTLEGLPLNKSKTVHKVISTLVPSPTVKKVTQRKTQPTMKSPINLTITAEGAPAEYSHDSNSTQIRSFPTNIQPSIDTGGLMEEDTLRDVTISESQPRLDPRVAQYVQRLLCMRRSSVRALGVSSSEVETPSTSILATESNIGMELINMQRVERFIAQNYEFVNELEQTLLSQPSLSPEKSIKVFEDLWKQHLSKNKSKTESSVKTKEVTKKTKQIEAPPKEQVRPTKLAAKVTPVKKQIRIATSTSKTKERTAMKEAKPKEVKSKEVKPKRQIKARDSNTFDKHRFSELADNCSERITELNGMLNRVRNEKERLLYRTHNSVEFVENQRLLDGTYSSVEFKSIQSSKSQVPPPSPITSINEQEVQSPELSTAPTTSKEATRLQKHAPIAGSRDSGISMSRPVTALDQRPVDNVVSEDTTVFESIPSSTVHHAKPPPTLKRYSPQFEADAVAHELSTIVEVETPATSRVNTSIQQTQLRDELVVQPVAEPFITFNQYIQGLQLDLTLIDPELSFKLEEQFNELLNNLRICNDNGVPRYREFPSLTTYLHNMTNGNQTAIQTSQESLLGFMEQTHKTSDELRVQELINCLRLTNLTIRSYPTQREYAKRMQQFSPNAELIDTASLENISDDLAIETDSETFHLEEELRRRKMLKNVTNSDSKSTKSCKCQPEPDSSTDAHENLGTGAWAVTMRRRTRETQALSSETTPSPDVQRKKKTNVKEHSHKEVLHTSAISNNSVSSSCECSDTIGSEDDGKMNLREFLTKELGRYCYMSSQSTSSPSDIEDNSLRQQFFQSILNSITPSYTTGTLPSSGTNGTTASSGIVMLPGAIGKNIKNTLPNISKSGASANANIRQKTSTPVLGNSRTSSTVSSNSNGNLFSCESNISDVEKVKGK